MNKYLRHILIYPILYLLIGLLLYLFQRQLLYYPSEYLQHNYPVLALQNQGEHIEIVKINPKQDQAVIYFGGNNETVLSSAYDLSQILPEYSLYLFNYRGYSGSTGTASEQAIYSDAMALYQQLSRQHTHISLIGRSLGSGVASYLAAHTNIDKLVLITPYDSIESLAQSRFIIYPMHWLIKDKYNSLERVPAISAPTLILLAEQDKIVPHSHSQRLIQAFPSEQIQVKTIKNSSHSNIVYQSAYLNTLKAYFKPKH